MKDQKRKVGFLVGGAAVFLVIMLGGIFFLQNGPFSVLEAETSSLSEGPAQASLLSTKMESLPDDTEIITAEGVSVEENLFEVSERSSLILYGRVSHISEPILLRTVYDSVSVHTDVEITPEKVFRGEADKTVTVRLSGGLVGKEYIEYQDEPELCLGKEYLLFLQQPDRGYGVNGPGEYYILTSLWRSVFAALPESQQKIAALSAPQEKQSDVFLANSSKALPTENFVIVDQWEDIVKGLSVSEAVLPLNTLEKVYPEFNKSYPVKEGRIYQETLEAYKANLESGFLSQEEYEYYLSVIDVYAEEITPEEAEEIAAKNETQKEELRKQLAEEEQQKMSN